MGLCRLCLNDCHICIEIFGVEGSKLNIAGTLAEFFWFEITQNDAISTLICTKCWYSTSTFQEFHTAIRSAQQSLYDKQPSVAFAAAEQTGELKQTVVKRPTDAADERSGPASLLDEQILDEPQYIVVTTGSGPADTTSSTAASIGDAVRYHVLNADDDSTAVCKAEPFDGVDAVVMYDIADDDEHQLVLNMTGKCVPARKTSGEQAKPPDGDFVYDDELDGSGDVDDGPNDATEPDYEEDEDDDEDEEEDDEDEDDVEYDQPDDEEEDLPIARRKANADRMSKAKRKKHHGKLADRDDEDRRIRAVCELFCNLCMMRFESFGDLTKHYRLAHDRKGYAMCCDRKISTRVRLLEHIETHQNPDAFQCSVCEARFSGRITLKRHMDAHVSDEQKPFVCADCPNRYSKETLLQRHRFNVHSAEADKTFVCTVCGKKYLSAGKLAEHVKRSHEFVPEICDYCGKEFKSIYNLNVHRTEVHMGHEVPRLQCNICGTWLREKYLKKHLKRHNADVETCTVCGKTLQNKNSLGNHMRNVHGNRMHQCAVCGKTFSKPLSLREHMALHTGRDLYTCPYCPKTFKSGANMHSHRKKFHFDDWTKDRGKRLVTSNY